MFRRSRTVILTAAAAAVLTLGASGVAGAADGPADAAGSSLVLGLIPVDTNPGSPVSVTLQCDPAGGTHPTPDAACKSLTAVGGEFAKLPNVPSVVCAAVYAPVEAVAQGTWNGTPVSYQETFVNACDAAAGTDNVFKF